MNLHWDSYVSQFAYALILERLGGWTGFLRHIGRAVTSDTSPPLETEANKELSCMKNVFRNKLLKRNILK